jgi:uncharacterized membrane protein
MESNNKIKNSARIAGLLYLIGGSSIAFVHLYILPKLIVWSDAAKTVQNIIASKQLFRIGILTELLGMTFFILVPIILYHLFKKVNKTQALLMAILCIIGIALSCANTLNQVAVLILLSGHNYLSGFDTTQLNTMVLFFFNLHSYGFLIAHMFFGLWLLPLSMLVYKSGFIPKIIGVLLTFALLGYLIEISTTFLFPDYIGLTSQFTGELEGLGELPLIFWLIIKGVNRKLFEKHVSESI